jgi:adenylate cyclase class 2
MTTAGHEIEVKLPVDNIDRLARSGMILELETPRHFEENRLFDTADRQLQKRFSVLRVRAVEGRGTLTFKEPPSADSAPSQFKKRVELETPVGDPVQIVAMIERLGYHQWFCYQKFRTVYRATLPAGRTLHVMFDETPLGNFVELEGEEAAVAAAVELLGASPEDYLLDSYIGLQAKYCAVRGLPLQDMVFPADAV